MKTHPLNVSYLVVGLAFLGIAGSWALHEVGAIGADEVEWLLPLSLVIAGAVGLVAFFAKGLARGRGEGDHAHPGTGQDGYPGYDDTDDTTYDDPLTYDDTRGEDR